MNEYNDILNGFEMFDNSNMSRVVNKITLTNSNQINFPAAFYSINKLNGKKSAKLFYNKSEKKIAIQFSDKEDPKGFRLVLSNDGKYGAYIAIKSFIALNSIDLKKFANRYDYEQVQQNGDNIYIISLKEDSSKGGNM